MTPARIYIFPNEFTEFIPGRDASYQINVSWNLQILDIPSYISALELQKIASKSYSLKKKELGIGTETVKGISCLNFFG